MRVLMNLRVLVFLCVIVLAVSHGNSLAGSIEDAYRLLDDNQVEEAVGILKVLSGESNSDAQYMLGKLLYYGNNGAGGPKEGFNYLRMSAESGNVKAICEVADIYLNGWYLSDKNYEVAAMFYSEAAKRGDIKSKYVLGSMYLVGRGVERDCNKALKLLNDAARGGCSDANVKLHSIYYNGSCGEVDFELAKQYLLSSYNNNGLAAYLLADMCRREQADCTDQQYYHYISRSYELGYIPSYSYVAECYMKGIGVPQDHKKAFKIYEEGAERGDVNCLNRLASFYRDGVFIPKNLQKARMYMMRASCLNK